jgi:methenyltetrahydrofolate cyclohydrolase
VCESPRVEIAPALTLPADLVERLAASERAPGGGSAAAAAVVLAAAVVEKVARLSDDWAEAAGCAAQAAILRRRAAPLVESDAEVYRTALAALAGEGPAGHALDRAAAVPLELAGIACDVALLAAEVARLGDPSLRPDAQTAVLLAEAATRAAARLVVENLASGDGERGERARHLAETAAAARHTVEL